MYRQLNTKQSIYVHSNNDNNDQPNLTYPFSVVFEHNKNHIIVSNWRNNCLQWFDHLTCKHLFSYGELGTKLGQFNSPSFCLQPIMNHLIVCDCWSNRVQVLQVSSPSITPLPLFAIGRKPTVNADGWVEDSKKKGEFNAPLGVCCSPDGSIHVAEDGNRRVQSFDCGGRFLSTFGDEKFRAVCFVHPYFSPSSLASGILCVTDHENNRVSLWSSSNAGAGPPQQLFNFPVTGSPRGLCVDLKGYLHVSCGDSSNTVRIFDLRKMRSTNPCTMSSSDNNKSNKNEPALIQTLGKDGGRGGRGSELGEFNDPTGMCVDNENVLMVVDMWNQRVQFFDEKI